MKKGYKSIAGLENLTVAQIRQRNLETYGESVKKFRMKAGMTVDQLADILQISTSSVRNWECGVARPDPEYLYRMFTILDVEPNEFFGIGGIGTLLTTNERTMLGHYRALDAAGKEDLESIAETMVSKSEVRKLKTIYDKINPVKDMGRVVAAGDGADWEDYPEEEAVLLYESPMVSRADEVFKVNGDSMEPLFHDGDSVLVEYCESDGLCPGDIGVFMVPGHGGVIKQVACDRLHSLNPKFDDIVPDDDGARAVGRVLCRVTKDMVPTHEERMLYEDAEAMFSE